MTVIAIAEELLKHATTEHVQNVKHDEPIF